MLKRNSDVFSRALFVEREQGCHVDVFVERGAAVEPFHAKFDEEVDVDGFRLEAANEVNGCLHRTACCEEVVVEQYDIIGLDSIFVYFYSVPAVFLQICGFYGFSGQLAWLAAHHEASAQTGGQNGAHDEAARLDSDHFRDAFVLVEAEKLVRHLLEALRILEKRADILKLDTRLREIRDVSQVVE